MFYNRYPAFSRGRILKLEMLEELRDFPRDFIDIVLSQYSDGIILGCDISVNDDYIVVSKGLIKHNDVIYMLKNECSINYYCTDDTVALKIRFIGETKNSDFIRYETELFIDRSLDVKTDEIELCRFKIKNGAGLRREYVNFEDASTEYDTINLINSPFASYKKHTLSPKLLKLFAKEAFRNNLNDPMDVCFCMTCLQESDSIDRELIINYISSRLDLNLREYSNEEIYYYLVTILKNIKQGGQSSNKSFKFDYKKILVD